MLIPHVLDTVPNWRPMGNIRVLEILSEHHEDSTQVRILDDIERLQWSRSELSRIDANITHLVVCNNELSDGIYKRLIRVLLNIGWPVSRRCSLWVFSLWHTVVGHRTLCFLGNNRNLELITAFDPKFKMLCEEMCTECAKPRGDAKWEDFMGGINGMDVSMVIYNQ